MKEKTKNSVLDLALIALFAGLIAVCSWISVPGPVPFTLQTFGVFLALFCLGGRRGTLSIIVYLLLGLIGVPVFAGFKAGPAALVGLTGGYLVGFLVSGLLMWALEKPVGKRLWAKALSAALGMAGCYLFGSLWFMLIYTRNTGAITFWGVLTTCVIPFLLFDAIKIGLALVLGHKLKPLLDRRR